VRLSGSTVDGGAMADGGALTDPGGDSPREDRMFVLVLAVPALLVVVTGYVVGYALAEWVCDLLGAGVTRTPEMAGWTTGLVLLAVVVWQLANRWRRGKEGRGRKGLGGKRRSHQK
jgi:hypothetical protein